MREVRAGLGVNEDEVADVRARLTRALARICPRWLRAAADDIVQTAVIRALGSGPACEGTGHLPTSYLEKAAYCAMIDEIRRRRRLREDALDTPAVLETAHPRPDPEREAVSRELGQGIRTCLATLVRPRQRAVALYLLGNTGPEMAALLGWSAKRVENLVYRGLSDLRQCLSRRGIEP